MGLAIAPGVDGFDLVVCREAVAERARIPEELGHPAATIEVFENPDHRLALGFRPGKAHGIPELGFRNIYSGFHASILNDPGIYIN